MVVFEVQRFPNASRSREDDSCNLIKYNRQNHVNKNRDYSTSFSLEYWRRGKKRLLVVLDGVECPWRKSSWLFLVNSYACLGSPVWLDSNKEV